MERRKDSIETGDDGKAYGGRTRTNPQGSHNTLKCSALKTHHKRTKVDYFGRTIKDMVDKKGPNPKKYTAEQWLRIMKEVTDVQEIDTLWANKNFFITRRTAFDIIGHAIRQYIQTEVYNTGIRPTVTIVINKYVVTFTYYWGALLLAKMKFYPEDIVTDPGSVWTDLEVEARKLVRLINKNYKGMISDQERVALEFAEKEVALRKKRRNKRKPNGTTKTNKKGT